MERSGWMLGMAKVCLFVIRDVSLCLSVSLVFVGWKIGLVFRLSDGTLVCPVADLVPRCCSSAEHDRGRGWGGTKSKKKVVGSGFVVLAHARYEGQGIQGNKMTIEKLAEEIRVAFPNVPQKTFTSGFIIFHFPAPYMFVPPIRDANCGSPILFPRILPETAASTKSNGAPETRATTRERRPRPAGGTREVTRRAVEVGTRWLVERANPRRSAPRWTRPKRKRTLSCEGKRRSFVCWRRRGPRVGATRAQRRSC